MKLSSMVTRYGKRLSQWAGSHPRWVIAIGSVVVLLIFRRFHIVQFFLEMDGTRREHIDTYASIVAAVFTAFLAVGLYMSAESLKHQKFSLYRTIDSTYHDIQKMIIEKPYLMRLDECRRDADKRLQYEAFAFLIWNLIESIYDYSTEDSEVRKTWACILKHEATLHREWFHDPTNFHKFKPEFRAAIRADLGWAKEAPVTDLLSCVTETPVKSESTRLLG